MNAAPMGILGRLAGHARERPSAIAIRSAQHCLTWQELNREVENFAAEALRRLPGARGRGVVAIAAASGPAFAVAYLGTLRAGCIVHPIPRNSTRLELDAFLRATGASLLVSDTACPDRHIPCMSAADVLRAGAGPVPDGLQEPGLYLPSSGTTGEPKIAVRSGPSLDAVAANVAFAAKLQPEDIVLAAVPMSHSYGMENGLLGPVWAGSCIHVFEPAGGVDTGELPAEIDRAGITVFPAVPFMVEVLAKLGRSPGCPTASLRLVYTAGSPLPAQVAEDFESQFGIAVGQLYGATEVGSVTFAEPGASRDSACVGRALPGVAIRVLDTENPRTGFPMSAGEEGQVAIRAGSMLSHYLDGDRSDPAFLDDYFLTGDLGRMDELGRLAITGRLKLLIDVGGFKVNPLEVERTLVQHASIAEAVVLPVRVTETVSRLKALVTPRSGRVSIDEVRAYAKERLSPHKVPRIFEVVARLPRSPTGKILRRELEQVP